MIICVYCTVISQTESSLVSFHCATHRRPQIETTANSNMRLLTLSLHVGRPQSQIVSEQLHDERRVFVAFLIQGIEFGNGLVECGLSQAAGSVW